MSRTLTVTVTATGRKTGMPREVELFAFEDGDRLVIVGSSWGAAKNPVWVGNLRAEPRATVRVGGKLRAVVAREVHEDAERERLWRLVSGQFPTYETFQRRTSRTIPLFLLEPAEEA